MNITTKVKDKLVEPYKSFINNSFQFYSYYKSYYFVDNLNGYESERIKTIDELISEFNDYMDKIKTLNQPVKAALLLEMGDGKVYQVIIDSNLILDKLDEFTDDNNQLNLSPEITSIQLEKK